MPEHMGTEIAGMPETSESEEMYLLTILRASEEGHEGPLGLASLAEQLEVSPASANEMIRKMDGRDLVTYEPYKGASLTPTGRAIATRVLRIRRLWARFLADRLRFTPRQADEMACDLEHVTTDEAADRLADYLGNPDSGPLGGPIPQAPEHPAAAPTEPLAQVPAGFRVEVVAVASGAQSTGFLSASGLEPGASITVAATGSGGVLAIGSRGEVHLDPSIAAAVLVRSAGGDAS